MGDAAQVSTTRCRELMTAARKAMRADSVLNGGSDEFLHGFQSGYFEALVAIEKAKTLPEEAVVAPNRASEAHAAIDRIADGQSVTGYLNYCESGPWPMGPMTRRAYQFCDGSVVEKFDDEDWKITKCVPACGCILGKRAAKPAVPPTGPIGKPLSVKAARKHIRSMKRGA